MGFLHGSVTFERFEVGGREVKMLDESHIETINKHAIGRTGALTADGVEVGFTAGRHLLDLDFSLERNVINDALVFGMRVDTNKIPSDLLKAYAEMELAAIVARAGVEYPSRKMRQEAKQAAEERCHDEAKTGKFRKMNQFPILWDTKQREIYFGAANQSAIERFISLFKEAFGRNLTRRSSGVVAADSAEKLDKMRALEDLSPTGFVGPGKSASIAWIANAVGTRDFLGNEFLLWLWWTLEEEADTITLSDGSTVACMMSKTLSLECPLAETGKETITSDSPVRLPEAKRAVEAGKLPRKAGLVLVRHDQQYELTLQAETFGVGGARLPKLERAPGRVEEEARIDQIRELVQTIDLLFAAFINRRLSSSWREDVKSIRSWLERE